MNVDDDVVTTADRPAKAAFRAVAAFEIHQPWLKCRQI
jgi:hypothetical protein